MERLDKTILSRCRRRDVGGRIRLLRAGRCSDPDEVSITDINADGKAEVTIPYKLFCGGGIETATVKIILREGALKLAIRGESEVRLPGQEPFGGKHDYDKLLLTPAYAPYKVHLDQVWKAVSRDIRH